MSKQEFKKGYVHYYQPAPLSKFPEGYQRIRIKSEEKFNKMISLIKPGVPVAMDLETTSLNPEKAEIVGMVVCFEPHRSFYIPHGHKVGEEHNLPMSLFDRLYEEVMRTHCTLWYNFGYDGDVLKHKGYDIWDLEYRDVLPMV